MLPGALINPSPSANENAGIPAPALIDQLAVVRGMLATLDSLTAAGQHHVMSKVIGFVDDQSRRALGGMSPRNRRAFMELLAHLRRESDRISSDITNFVRRAEALIALLAAVV